MDADVAVAPPAEPEAKSIAEQIEENDALDDLVKTVSDALPTWITEGRGRELLSGRWLGHSLHPLLTDLPIGFWTSAAVLDLVGGKRSADAAQRLVGWGLLTSLPTAAAGLSDWSRLGTTDRRTGLVHAQCNTAALVAYWFSYRARRRGRRGRGVLWGMVGGLAASAGGYLGGHLTVSRAVTRDDNLLPS